MVPVDRACLLVSSTRACLCVLTHDAQFVGLGLEQSGCGFSYDKSSTFGLYAVDKGLIDCVLSTHRIGPSV